MKKIIITCSAVAAVAMSVIAVFPAATGPVNRVKNNITNSLNSEFAVDNCEAERDQLRVKRIEIVKNIHECEIERQVISKKIDYAAEKEKAAKAALLAAGSSDMNEFNRRRKAYESFKSERESLAERLAVTGDSVKLLKNTLAGVESTISKLDTDISEYRMKKKTVELAAGANRLAEDLNHVGDMNLAEGLAKIDDDMLRESIKQEVLFSHDENINDRESADSYLKALAKD